MEKTHWRKAFNSDYLACSDVPSGGTLKLVIKEVKLGTVRSQNGESSTCNMATFTDSKVKPMIMNVTNSKIVKGFAKSGYLEDWINIPVEIYAKDGVRLGRETTEGLRIKPTQPKTVSDDQVNEAIKTLKDAEDLNAAWKTIAVDVRNDPRVLSTAKSLKK